MNAVDADYMHLKRSFAQVATSTYITLDPSECYSSKARLLRSYDRGRAPPKRRLAAFSTFKMPVQTGPSLVSTSLSPFARDFGDAPNCALHSHSQREDNPHLYNTNTHTLQQPNQTTFPPTGETPISFEHRESVSSAVSESTGSSPTTTISTFDTPSVTDTSPSSSPESPSALPISYPKPMILPEISERIAMHPVSNAPSISVQLAQPIGSLARAPSPSRRARNLKNLSLRMPCSNFRPAVSTASIMETTSQNFSAPPSPSHRPIKTGRRKPTNLTIRTPSLDQSFSRSITEIVPPTPSISIPSIPQRSLRHFESSPSLASIFSPTTAPPGGMQLPRPSTRDGMPRMPGSWQEDSPASQSGPALQQVVEEDYHPDSRESTKRTEQSYPDGPIKIYDSGVYLFLEPTRAEACKFDVVVNVAKEVVNPFADDIEKTNTVVSTLRRPYSVAQRFSIAEPMTAISEASFHSAFEVMPDSESPTTPKAENGTVPEYIHVPWDHNSEILDDLGSLCQLIDDRISQGKNVLIHCQLGASRSASLVIAYGLYKNRDLDFNDMYSIVKNKSCWVGPNMSLIYQLTDFRARLQRGEPSKAPNDEWFKTRPLSQPSQTPPFSMPEPMDTTEPRKTEPERVFLKPVSYTEPSKSTDRVTKATPQLRKSKSGLRVRGISPRPLPLREKYQDFQTGHFTKKAESRKPSHSRYPSVQMDLVMQDVPASPSILSPRAAPYMCSSLSRTLAGDLAGDAPSHFGFEQPPFDPRSPSQRRELLITRNIDEVL
ncbi:hypothetical protein BGW36DRAFT_30042 [Talaromyces proteolyticus]|uniref:protein-tyrosine-phosphatase n=1 Tax=Talaromyces proteolyticus TaxID=1131652 RepID=A0AAD4PXM9_9EURO|nr:uncharacterized protein BGW36DRAFT_30042 [Talaromyces proteolyticus]KAH8692898.1 hypothetical protein BGW36DRAFT_30042 [Talaromyces proteolyticus]